MKKRIHVNQHNIKRNKTSRNLPVITVKTYKDNHYAHSVIIEGPSKLVYPEKPMKCGARVWIETSAPVTTVDKDGNFIETVW